MLYKPTNFSRMNPIVDRNLTAAYAAEDDDPTTPLESDPEDFSDNETFSPETAAAAMESRHPGSGHKKFNLLTAKIMNRKSAVQHLRRENNNVVQQRYQVGAHLEQLLQETFFMKLYRDNLHDRTPPSTAQRTTAERHMEELAASLKNDARVTRMLTDEVKQDIRTTEWQIFKALEEKRLLIAELGITHEGQIASLIPRRDLRHRFGVDMLRPHPEGPQPLQAPQAPRVQGLPVPQTLQGHVGHQRVHVPQTPQTHPGPQGYAVLQTPQANPGPQIFQTPHPSAGFQGPQTFQTPQGHQVHPGFHGF